MGSINNEFRLLPLEVLAGEGRTQVELRERGAVFAFDFAEVYWNSRLQTEHARLVDSIIAPAAAVSDGKEQEKKPPRGRRGESGGGGSGKERSRGPVVCEYECLAHVFYRTGAPNLVGY